MPVATFAKMVTFMQGGTALEDSTGSAPLVRSSAHGVWKNESERNFTYALQFFRFNADGTYSTLTRARWRAEVDMSGNSYSASATIAVFNPSGAQIATACATETAIRFEDPTNTAPEVTITSPANNTVFSTSDTITFVASASSPNGIAKVEFFSGDFKLNEDTTPPYTYSQSNVKPGTYTVTAVATDNRGATTRSSPITIIVR
jgi:hypothetical protein